MKVLIAIAVVAVLVAAVHAVDDDEMKKHALEQRQKCLADLKGDEAELKELEEKHEVTTDFAKKMTLCMFRAFKIVDENDKYSKANIMEIAKKVLDGKPESEKKLKVAEEIADACDKEVGALQGAPEDTAKAVFDCLKKNVVEKTSGVRYGFAYESRAR
nr:odorant-binding protein [Odontothrips loti]